jgi:hypothetical protein
MPCLRVDRLDGELERACHIVPARRFRCGFGSWAYQAWKIRFAGKLIDEDVP